MDLYNEIKEIRQMSDAELNQKGIKKPGPYRGALIGAAIKRYKFQTFVEFIKFYELNGNIKNKLSYYFADEIAQKTVGRSFGQSAMTKKFGISGRTAAERSYYMQKKNNQEKVDLMDFLQSEWQKHWEKDRQAYIRKCLQDTR